MDRTDLRFRENGSLYLTRPWVYDELHNRLGGRIGMFELDDLEGVDIDTELDFALAEQQMDQYLAVHKVLQRVPDRTQLHGTSTTTLGDAL